MPVRTLASLSLLGAIALALPACSRGSDDDTKADTQADADAPSDAAPVFRSYTVRATITQLPTDDAPALMARHEAIPDFDGGDEQGMGMDVMTMPFWPPFPSRDGVLDPSRVPDELDLSGFAVGDDVAITFEVQHASDGAPPSAFYATAIEPLPEGTQLDFETRLPDTIIFETRGEVVHLPGPLHDFEVRHEAVPDFPNPDGTTGMDVMVMPFWPPVRSQGVQPQRIPDDLDLQGIEVGDKVLITWEVQVDRATRAPIGFYALDVEELPADTELDFTPLAEQREESGG